MAEKFKIKVVKPDKLEKIIELSDMCKWDVVDEKLYNKNTRQFEGVEGDGVGIPHTKKVYVDGVKHMVTEFSTETVKGYTMVQMIETYETGGHILSCDGSAHDYHNATIHHKSKVYKIEN